MTWDIERGDNCVGYGFEAGEHKCAAIPMHAWRVICMSRNIQICSL